LASPRLHLIKAGAEVAPGVTTLDTAGHTPGHMSVHLSSGSEEMLVTGDVVADSEVSLLPRRRSRLASLANSAHVESENLNG
jgi:glyoxylase-like metal-dependent hydrolase (beta-lactamase superfamily II)